MLEIDLKQFMKNLTGLLAGILLLSSCYDQYNDSMAVKPENLIYRDTIVLILADIEIAESALRHKQNYGMEIKNKAEAYFNEIFKRYKVSKEQFDSSMTYYKEDVDVINEIYEDVITRLSLMQSEVQME